MCVPGRRHEGKIRVLALGTVSHSQGQRPKIHRFYKIGDEGNFWHLASEV